MAEVSQKDKKEPIGDSWPFRGMHPLTEEESREIVEEKKRKRERKFLEFSPYPSPVRRGKRGGGGRGTSQLP